MAIVFFGDLFRETVRGLRHILTAGEVITDGSGELSVHAVRNLTSAMFDGLVTGQRMMEAAAAHPAEASAVLAETPGAPVDENGDRTIAALQAGFVAVRTRAEAFRDDLEAYVDGPLAAVKFAQIVTQSQSEGLSEPASGRSFEFSTTIPAAVAGDLRAMQTLLDFLAEIEARI